MPNLLLKPLLGYLYGKGAETFEVDGRQVASETRRETLHGPSAFPAGLFADDRASGLSGVVFTNACTLGKFNRVMATTAGPPTGLRYVRFGEFFNRAPGTLKGIPFCLDVTRPEYRSLWPQGNEPWNAELEVFHNPFARYSAPLELLPEATHWLLNEGGDLACRPYYSHGILWSTTLIQNDAAAMPTLDDLRQGKQTGTPCAKFAHE